MTSPVALWVSAIACLVSAPRPSGILATFMAKTVTVAIVGYPGCSAWITAGLLELFAIANNARATLGERAAATARFDCHIVGRSRRAVRGSHGVQFPVHALRSRYDAAIVPPVWCESLADLEVQAQRLRTQNAFIADMARRSKIFASTCSGAVLLAQAGLLSGRRVTTCWWLVNWFRQAFPDIEMAPDRLVMRDGNRWTAAAGAAYMHLALDLVRELAGAPLAAAARSRRSSFRMRCLRKPIPKSSAQRAICVSTQASSLLSPASVGHSPSASARWRADSSRVSACRR
jgi:transcriptional regulator GlxA family with amidase domain